MRRHSLRFPPESAVVPGWGKLDLDGRRLRSLLFELYLFRQRRERLEKLDDETAAHVNHVFCHELQFDLVQVLVQVLHRNCVAQGVDN